VGQIQFSGSGDSRAVLGTGYRFSLTVAESALRIAGALDDPNRLAFALWRTGRANDLVGRSEQAEGYLTGAVQTWQQLDDDVNMPGSLVERIRPPVDSLLPSVARLAPSGAHGPTRPS
jgi:hypothetical protein